jgi:4-amino-4-deoxy-L-arabinose transferase-like glycosyltransferase
MMARLRVSTWSALAVGIGFLLAEVIMLDARIRDYDEGVFWATIRALARGEPMFSTVFATSPPAFFYSLLPFYLVGHSLASLRAGVLLLCLIGLAATYFIGRLLAGNLGGLVAVLLAATSSVFWHESTILQADGPSLALSTVAVALSMLAVRTEGRSRDALAAATGLALAFSVGSKFFGVVAAVPIAMVIFGASRGRGRLLATAVLGGVVGLLILLVPVIGSPQAAYKQLIVSHLRAGELAHFGIGRNLGYVFLRHELPLEALGLAGALVALIRRDRTVAMPLAWAVVSMIAILGYEPIFPHHLVLLTPSLALLGAVGVANARAMGRPALAIAAALVVSTAAVGVAVDTREALRTLAPDLHDAEMTAAVRAHGQQHDYWFSDNAYAVSAADRDIPGPVVDTSGQLALAGLLTVDDLERTRVRYDVRWILVDNGRLERFPGFHAWLLAHFHPVQRLGGGAVIYEAGAPAFSAAQLSTEFG